MNKLLELCETFIMNLLNRLDKPTLENRVLLGQLLSQQMQSKQHVTNLSDVEFKIFSQHCEDGIIQYLTHQIPILNKSFVEFGVTDYRESNTRFLLFNNRWRGLIMDSGKKHISRIQSSGYYWQYNLTAVRTFITRENINQLLTANHFEGDIGLLSIDIDGNDYWIWEAITVVQPRIVVCEYNSIFGKNLAVTIPYQADFNRTQAHYSNLYFGASLKALCLLAEKKGYVFVGSDSSGTNAFFVRKDVARHVTSCTCEKGYVEGLARESRDAKGRLTFVSGNDRIKLIAHKTVFDIPTQKETSIKELIG